MKRNIVVFTVVLLIVGFLSTLISQKVMDQPKNDYRQKYAATLGF